MKAINFLPSYVMSLLLKKRGFKPPEPNAGQFWYGQHSNLVVISEVDDYLVAQTGENNDTHFFPKTEPPSGKDAIYAPQCHEIRSKMPEPEKVSIESVGKYWICTVKTDMGDKVYRSNNPSEACARAWLDLNPDMEHWENNDQ